MDLYRQNIDRGCHSHSYWQRLRRVARPTVDPTRIKELYKRENVLFYAKKDVYGILGEEAALDDILRCRESCCKQHLMMADTEPKMIKDSVLNKNKPKVILLAILIYLGKSYMIWRLSKHDKLHDSALDALHGMASESDSTWIEMWADLLKRPTEGGKLSKKCREEIDTFLENYRFVTNLFDLPVFSTQNSWDMGYSEDRRLPFLDDELHCEGTDTDIHKFNIHEDYLDVDPKYAQKEWYLADSKVSKFRC
jgi:hypothetical protein